jgi:hypothetical protein
VFEGSAELVTGVAAVEEHIAQPQKGAANAYQQLWCSVAVLGVGGVNDHPDRQADRVGQNVALAPL